MIDQSEWLHRLGSNRPTGTALLTSEILLRTGRPPVPPRGGPKDDAASRFIAFRVIPLLADDNCRRAAQRAGTLRASAASQAAVDDATAEQRFWADVRDWTKTWEHAAPGECPMLWLQGVRIPRQLAHS
jgi:hypothetical protein